jgi:hypothetical protein
MRHDVTSGLWLIDTAMGTPRLIARGPISGAGFSPEGDRVLFHFGTDLIRAVYGHHWDWVYDIPGQSRRRIDGPTVTGGWALSSSVRHSSPRGKYIAIDDSTFIYAIDGRWGESVPPAPYYHYAAAGWAPDETALYWAITPQQTSNPEESRAQAMVFKRNAPNWDPNTDTLILKTTPVSGETEVITSLTGTRWLREMSPNGTYLALGWQPSGYDDQGRRFSYTATTILQSASGETIDVHGVLPEDSGWTPSGESIWCQARGRDATGQLQTDAWVLIEASGGMRLAELPAPEGLPIRLLVSHDGDRLLLQTNLLAAGPAGPGTPASVPPTYRDAYYVWVANSDGTAVRKLHETTDQPQTIGWTSDGKVIVADSAGRGPVARIIHVCRIDPDTGQTTTLLDATE